MRALQTKKRIMSPANLHCLTKYIEYFCCFLKNTRYIYGVISTLKKYLFGLVVTAYVVSAVGIPIYLHYCGGELEKINYVVKGTSCCDDDEGENSEMTNGCCKDENVYLKNNADFTIKQLDFELTKAVSQIFFISLPYSSKITAAQLVNSIPYAQPDPVLQQGLEISTSVLRI